jgi:tRNA U34 5-methylaminomethyl-2-thiouridine-forming methyltransferase MnmC
MLERKIVLTNDGSSSFFLPEWNEHFHSHHGAIQEAYHVFIKNGLESVSINEVSILEIGYGTGLNALITLLESDEKKLIIKYTGIDALPINKEEHLLLNYCKFLKRNECTTLFNNMFDAKWEEYSNITKQFSLRKINKEFTEITFQNEFDIIYFDAFSPRVQPELWTEEMFKTMFEALTENGLLTTYSAKGSVRRAMQSVGFQVKKIPGPPGKREMLVGFKIPNSKF